MILHDTVSILVAKENKILLIKRSNPPMRGYWSLPAGHVEKDEPFQKAAQREANEEAGGIKISHPLFTFVHSSKIGHLHRCHVYRGVASGKVRAGSDAEKLSWFTLERMKKMNTTAPTLHVLNKIYEKRL